MGKKESSAPPVPNPAQQAGQISAAQDIYDPRAAQRNYEILSNPQYGLLPLTQLQEQVRQQVFPQEQGVRQQLGQNVLGQLQSPTGITPEQQAAINARRSQAQSELQAALRNRANLGGGLYGGRSAQEEDRAVSDLQNAFVEEDIGREERARLNAIQAAFPYLQMLFPNSGIVAPQFQSAVQDPNTYASSLIQQRGQDIGMQQSADASRSSLYQALLGSVGQAAGGYFGPGGAWAGRQAGNRIGGSL